jgi:ABC-type Mn2+/Zn2+ transport system ATPase subunit
MTAALAIRSLAKRYQVGVPGCSATVEVLRGVNLLVGRGELVEVAGPVASGKSTLLLCAAGLLRPDRGRITWFGVSTVGVPPVAAYVAAECFPRAAATVREHVNEWVRRTPLTGRQGCWAVDAALGRMGLHRVALAPLAELGPGARWRLLVARAMLAEPRLLLLDEPFAGLAEGEREALARCLDQVAGSGIAVVVASTPGDAGATGALAATLCGGRLRPLPSRGAGGANPGPDHARQIRVAGGSA